jgi:hypothetical protein
VTMPYEYDQEDRLASPHQYMYADFQGAPFLAAYRQSRGHATESIRQQAGEAAPHWRPEVDRIVEALRVLRSSSGAPDGSEAALHDAPPDGSPLVVLDPGVGLETATVLDAVVTDLAVSVLTDSVSPYARRWLDRLVQRFEVTKRLYDGYLPGFRKGQGSHETVGLYAHFALCLAGAYASTGQLNDLSCLLKVCDLLVSSHARYIADSSLSALVLEVVGAEVYFITDLINQLEV